MNASHHCITSTLSQESRVARLNPRYETHSIRAFKVRWRPLREILPVASPAASNFRGSISSALRVKTAFLNEASIQNGKHFMILKISQMNESNSSKIIRFRGKCRPTSSLSCRHMNKEHKEYELPKFSFCGFCGKELTTDYLVTHSLRFHDLTPCLDCGDWFEGLNLLEHHLQVS